VPKSKRLQTKAIAAALAWLLGCGLFSCGPAASSEPGPRRPPPKPGSSITHTQMCSCRVCEPRACCAGAEDEEAGSCEDREAEVGADGYDFRNSEHCGMAVSSCVGRCHPQVWRIPLVQRCEDTLPAVCCGPEG